MKVTKSWRTRGYLSAKFFGLLIGLGAIAGFLVPSVMAIDPGEGQVINVLPGAGTLKKAVEDAPEGATLKLSGGSYTGEVADRTVAIDKNLTIEGVGQFNTVVNVPLKITGEGKKVTIKNIFSGMQQVEPNYIYFQVDAPNVELTIENTTLWGILRSDSVTKKMPVHEAKAVDITDKADGLKLTVKDSDLSKPGIHYGISNKASNTTITLEGNSMIAGRNAILFEDGESNKLTVGEGSEVLGPSISYTDQEAIVIKKQTGLTIDIDGGRVTGSIPVGVLPVTVFSFGEGDEKSTGTTINLKNGAIVSDRDETGEPDKGSIIFGFGEGATAADNNVVNIDGTSEISISNVNGSHDEESRSPMPLARKFGKIESKAVVSVEKVDGSRTVKVMDAEQEITELKNAEYNTKERYNFKGWFNDVDGERDGSTAYGSVDSYPQTAAGTNLDLYPKFLKKVKVIIGEEHFDLEEGQTLEDIEGIDAKLDALKKDNQNHKGYILHGETGGDMSYTAEDVEELKDHQITEDVTVEAVHNVTLTVNDKEFEIDAGQKVADITDQEGYKTAKLNGKDGSRFSRLVYDGGDTTFDEENTPVNENTKVVTKHYAEVSLEWAPETKYYVEEGKRVSEDREGTLAEALTAKENEAVENKTFKQFEDGEGNKVEAESTVTKDMEVEAKYTVTVKIGEKNYTLDEGRKLSSLSDKQDEIKEALRKLATDVKSSGQDFQGFIVSMGGEEERIAASEAEVDTKINEIIEKEINANTDIYADYETTVTIKCPDSAEGACDGQDKKEFTVETGSRLSDLSDNMDYGKAKYGKYVEAADKDERFVGFVTEGTSEPFTEEQQIEKSVTLVPKYYAYVTIEDDRPDVAGEFKVEEGGSLSALVPKGGAELDVQAILTKLQSNIEPTEEELAANPEAENLHFDQLVDLDKSSDGTPVDVSEQITEDIRIGGLYHYDVIIVQDYDNPSGTLGDVDANRFGFKVYKGRNFTTSLYNEQIVQAMGKLKESVNQTEGRRFYRYLDTNMGVTYDETGIMGKAFNRHVYISAQVEYKVTIDGDESEYYVVDGQTIGSNETIGAAMDELVALTADKKLNSYTLNGTPMDKEAILAETVSDATKEIGTKWDVVVTINGQEFVIPEGGTLESLDEAQQALAREALQAVINEANETEVDGKKFDGFSVGEGDAKDIDSVMKHAFNVNTTVVAKQAVIVTIDGNEYGKGGGLSSGQTLQDIGEIDTIKNKCENADLGRVFFRFAVVESGETFAEDTPFDKSIELETKCAFKITVEGDDSYRVEEGSALGSDAKLAAKMDELKTAKPDKTFKEFVDGEGRPVTKEKTVPEKKMEVKPIYQVTVTINGTPFTVEEGGNLKAEQVGTLLDRLEGVSDKKFVNYLVDGNKLSREELMGYAFNENVTVEPEYKVEVKIDDATVELVPGTKFGESNELKEKLAGVSVPEGKVGVAYFVDEAGKLVDDDYVFDTNTTLTPKFKVKVVVEGVGEAELLEGDPVRKAEELVAKLTNNEDKDFKEFEGGKGLDEEINTETTLKPLYTVNVTVKDLRELANYARKAPYKVDEGTTLKQLAEEGEYANDKPATFTKFVDETGNDVQMEEELHKHTTVYAMYTIKVTLPGKDAGEEVDAGTTLAAVPGVDEAKKDAAGREFARFVKLGTNETVAENEPLFEDLAVEPKFFNKVTISGQDDEGNQIEGVEPLGLLVEEGQPLSHLTDEQATKRNTWLRDNMLALATAGKPDYAFSHYMDENGDIVNADTVLPQNNAKYTAVFTYQPEAEVPEVPDDYVANENTAGTPDTGYNGETHESANFAVAGIAILVALVGAGLSVVCKNRQEK